MRYYLFSLMFQILVALHALRTGRDRWWVWVILFFPFLGAVIYLLAEVLPELVQGRTGRRVARAVTTAIDPQRRYREAAAAFEQSDTADNRRALAEACLELGRGDEAEPLLRGALKGVHADDPHLMLGLSQAQELRGDWQGARETLERLIAANPEFRSPEGHLRYARALHELGDAGAARHELEALVGYYPGPEPKVRLARLARADGQVDYAERLLREVATDGRRATRHARDLHRAWYDAAEKEAS